MKTRVKHFTMSVALGWSFGGCGHDGRPVNHAQSSPPTIARNADPPVMTITGMALSSLGYGPALVMGVSDGSPPEKLVLLLPVVGPILWVAGLDENTCGQPGNVRCNVSRPLLLVASGAQVVGLTLSSIDQLCRPNTSMQSMLPGWRL